METNINYCKVRGCRYKLTHTTRGHICGTCGNMGHGQYECNNYDEKERLKEYYNDVIDISKRCNLLKCNSNIFHTIEAHNCEYCGIRGHSIYNCPNREILIKCPMCRIENKINGNQKKIVGINIECCICMNKNVEIFFPVCGHVCICNDCYIEIIK